MKQTRRRSPILLVAGSIGLVLILIASACAYWQYVNFVPPFVPHLPPVPSPNGYLAAERAAMALQSTTPAPQWRWPDGTPTEIRTHLAHIRPYLIQVRAQFRSGWSALPDLLHPQGHPLYNGFRACAQGFAAESILRHKQEDYAGAMPPALDAMELAARFARGGSLVHWQYALAIHAIGLSQAERLALQLPAAAVPASLTRVRRLWSEWPRLPEMLEAEGVVQRALSTEYFTRLGERSPIQQWQILKSNGHTSAIDALRLLLTRRQTTLIHLDDYYHREAAEARKPARERRPVPLPGDAWFQPLLTSDPLTMSDGLEGPRTDLALLEVALAARANYLEHGRYPARLSDIPRQWLPVVPRDVWDQPIAYRLRNGQPVIYSLGPDGNDDGGQPADPNDLTPTTRGDLVFGHLTRHLHQK